jgi:heme/copper-type cytochrome/quinol oxidase subunit 4
MSKETLVFLLGIALTIIPFLGIPESWKHYLVVGAGVTLIFIGYALRRAAFLTRIDRGDGERGTDSFVETTKRLFE